MSSASQNAGRGVDCRNAQRLRLSQYGLHDRMSPSLPPNPQTGCPSVHQTMSSIDNYFDTHILATTMAMVSMVKEGVSRMAPLPSSVPATEDLIERMQQVLPRYHLLLKTALTGIGGDDRLTLPQIRSLQAIAASDGGMLTSILARHLRSAPPTVTRIIDGLVERKLVERQADPEDRRRWRLVILPAGEDVLSVYETRLHDLLAARVATLPDERRTALWNALDELAWVLSDPETDPTTKG